MDLGTSKVSGLLIDDLSNSTVHAFSSIETSGVKKGSIINIIDIHADPPLKDHIIYNISKAGLLSLTKTLAKDLAPHVRVNGVSPGAIMWPKQDLSNKKKQKEILSRIPLKRAGVPNDIAKAVLFLIEHSDYVTGQNIDVDGGRKLNM